jgi:hypothetical protein
MESEIKMLNIEFIGFFVPAYISGSMNIGMKQMPNHAFRTS